MPEERDEEVKGGNERGRRAGKKIEPSKILSIV